MGHFAFWFGLTGLLLGAVFGAMDYDLPGGLVGAVLGGIGGSLFGEVLDLLIGPFFGPREDRRLGRWILRLIGLAFVLVFMHELYWMLNLVAVTATHNLGAHITRAVARGDPRPAVKQELQEKRWQMALCTARPMRWVLRDDILAGSEATLEIIDFLNGKGIDRTRRDAKLDEARQQIWPPGSWQTQSLADDQELHATGKRLADRNSLLLDKYLPKTLLLRFLPRDFLIPKEG